jgi:2-polyprenyl-3-methyl-5-hydroxy-6-metoxy-1,4-benzoquinol methylase
MKSVAKKVAVNVNKGFFIGLEKDLRHKDQELGRALALFFINEGKPSVVDLGCGLGFLVKELRDHQIKCDGFDGNPSTPEITSWIDSKPPCRVLDLSEPILFPQKYDWAISLEVGEHIPKEFEDEFINNLHNNNIKGIILSWAIKGQPGNGHINCQNNDYIKSKMCELGYINDMEAEKKLRDSSTLWWFKNTIMVFRKLPA